MKETIFLCAVLFAVVLFVQYALCLKSKKKGVRLIPVYLIIVVYAISVVLYLSDYITGNGGVAIGSIFAYITAIGNTVALVADIIAWVVYKHIRMKRE